MLLNRARANLIMDKYGLEALVAAEPINIYYLSDYYGSMLQMARNFTLYALLPRDETKPAQLIMPGSGVYHLEHNPTWIETISCYVTRIRPGAIPPRDFDTSLEEYEPDEPRLDPSTPAMPYPIGPGVQTERDTILLDRYDALLGQMEVTALYALRKSIRAAGLERGNIGFDDPRILGWLQSVGLPDLHGRDALNIFREIRMVKSEAELDIMRKVGRMTEAALDVVIDAIEPGLPLADLHAIHAKAMVDLGGRSEWIIANIRGLATGVVEPNELIKLDSVGSYKEYRGDVGRTVICGTPTEEMLRRNQAVTRALQVAYENIRPGKSVKDIVQLTLDTVRADGFPGFCIAGPHAVGLEHTDHPVSIGPELPGTHDLVFEENMVFTLDMPYHEFGWGTTHVEDMIIVRKDHCEAITSMDTSLRIKPL
jgi:Xaa-Pro aminopeptidase